MSQWMVFSWCYQWIQYLGPQVYWGTPDGKPPKDTPDCGFLNELCPETHYSKFVN